MKAIITEPYRGDYAKTKQVNIEFPDEPAAPKSEWIVSKRDKNRYFNFATGLMATFDKMSGIRFVDISPIQCRKEDADAFAALVGYDWPSAGKEM